MLVFLFLSIAFGYILSTKACFALFISENLKEKASAKHKFYASISQNL